MSTLGVQTRHTNLERGFWVLSDLLPTLGLACPFWTTIIAPPEPSNFYCPLFVSCFTCIRWVVNFIIAASFDTSEGG